MSNLTAARIEMATSLAFHIVFAALGVGFPVLLCAAEGLGLRTGDGGWYELARKWGKAFGILFVIGAVSGTVLSFELGLLWPRFMAFAGGVIGLPFALEGFAFFLEAIFLGLYLYGWERLSPRAHWLTTIPLIISGTASAWFVVTANSWMNTPAGFRVANGRPTDVQPIAAIFNPGTPTETLHTILSCYQVTAFAVASIYAFALLRGHRTRYNRRGLLLGMLFGMIVAPVQALVGDASARMVAHQQPTKLAAMEALFHTTAGAPLRILGIVNPATQQVMLSLEIPHLLSILAFGDPNATVRGLDAVPRAEWPNVPVVHFAFDLMVGAGFLTILLPAAFWFLFWRSGHHVPLGRWLLWLAVLTGPLTLVAMEAGWMVTEIGRQPWIIYHVMLVRDAVTPAPGVVVSLVVFIAIYVLLAATLIWLLLGLAREPATAEATVAAVQ